MKKMIFLMLISSIYSCSQRVCFEERSINELKKVFSKDSLNKGYFNSLQEYKLTSEEMKLSEELIEKAFIKHNNNLNRGNYQFKKLPSFKEYGYILSPCINKKEIK